MRFALKKVRALLVAVLFTMLLPTPLFRQYLDHFERRGVVPFGVPIAASLIGVEVLRALSVPTII